MLPILVVVETVEVDAGFALVVNRPFVEFDKAEAAKLEGVETVADHTDDEIHNGVVNEWHDVADKVVTTVYSIEEDCTMAVASYCREGNVVE